MKGRMKGGRKAGKKSKLGRNFETNRAKNDSI